MNTIVLTATIPACSNCCPPVVFCHDAWGDTLLYAMSGVTLCGGCYTADGVDYSITFTGVNGVGTITWNGVSLWVGVIGTLTVKKYFSGDGTCVDLDSSFAYDISLNVGCSGESVIDIANAGGSAGAIGFSVFNGALPSALDTPIVDPATIANCGFQAPTTLLAAYGGTLTLSTP